MDCADVLFDLIMIAHKTYPNCRLSTQLGCGRLANLAGVHRSLKLESLKPFFGSNSKETSPRDKVIRKLACLALKWQCFRCICEKRLCNCTVLYWKVSKNKYVYIYIIIYIIKSTSPGVQMPDPDWHGLQVRPALLGCRLEKISSLPPPKKIC